jgi:glycosyltransferase involved in cell wall biosynthesis
VLRVLIDCTGITRNKAGVGIYAKNLISELIRLRINQKYFLLVQDDDPDLAYDDVDNVTMLRVSAKYFRKLPLRFLLEQAVLPGLLVKHRIDVLHSLHYSFPLIRFGKMQVVTLHDMTFFNMPEVHQKIKVFYFRFFIRAALRHPDKLIFVSNSAMQDYISRLGSPRGSAVVIYHGKSEAYRTGLDPTEIKRVRGKYGLNGDFILFIGTIEPRKNLSRLVSAFAGMCGNHSGLVLAIAGMKGWMVDDLMETIRRFKLESRIVFTGFVQEEEKPFLIAAAKAFTYPSLYEGFGIPVLEALACGVPTVTSNSSSLPEVAGDAALTVDPRNISELSDALEKVVSDEALREQLRKNSLVQAAAFTWENTARMTMQAYEDVIRHKLE